MLMTSTLSEVSENIGRSTHFSIVIVGAASMGSYAQHGYKVTKQVRFETGDTSARLEAALPGYLEGHEYLVRARSGQSLNIALTTNKRGIGMSVSGPDGRRLEGTIRLADWCTRLEQGGVYHIVVNAGFEEAVSYTLGVSVD
jgi:hypothetical protein